MAGEGEAALRLVFDHLNIRTDDLAASRRFYVEVLGLWDGPRPPLGHDGHWLYDAPGGRMVLHLSRRDGLAAPGDTGRVDHVAFRVVETEALLARLETHGIALFDPRFDADGRRTRALIRDPNGVVVELLF